MAEASNSKKRAGVTPKKLALIGFLAVVFIAELYVQFGRSSGDGATELAAAGPRSKRPTESAAGKTDDSAKATASADDAKAGKEWLLEPIDRPHWKAPELAQVVRYDPFAMPAAFPQAGVAGAAAMGQDGVVVANDVENSEEVRSKALAEIQTKLAELKQKGVRVIIDGRQHAAAIVGDRTIHVGDDIEGFTVKAIDADGVVVERKLD